MRRSSILHDLLRSLLEMLSSFLRNLTLIVLAPHHPVVLQTLLIKLHCSLQIWCKSLLGVFAHRMLRTRPRIFRGCLSKFSALKLSLLLTSLVFFKLPTFYNVILIFFYKLVVVVIVSTWASFLILPPPLFTTNTLQLLVQMSLHIPHRNRRPLSGTRPLCRRQVLNLRFLNRFQLHLRLTHTTSRTTSYHSIIGHTTRLNSLHTNSTGPSTRSRRNLAHLRSLHRLERH